MKVFVFGGGESVGEHILKRLAAGGHEAVTIAHTENRAKELKNFGATKVIVTSDSDFTEGFVGCEAIIYVGKASLSAGENQNILVDHKSVIHSVKEAKRQDIERFIYLSAVRADESEQSQVTGAKNEPEELIEQGEFVYTIVRSTKMTNKPGKGTIKAMQSNDDKEGEIPYEDAAAVLVESLENSNSFNKKIIITAGDTPIQKALQTL